MPVTKVFDFFVFGEFESCSKIVFGLFLSSFGILFLSEFDSLALSDFGESFDDSWVDNESFCLGVGVGGVIDFSFLASSPIFVFQFVLFKT